MTTPKHHLATALAGALLLTLAVVPGAAQDPVELDPLAVPGLTDTVQVRRDVQNIPHITAQNDHDALFMLGWVHAEDRFFQMDVLRRTFSGTLAELVGAAALPQDVQLRTLGLHRGAEESVAAISDGGREWLDAYVDGVNAWLAQTPAMPPEYGALALTKASVPAWTAVDTSTIAKGLAFGLSFGLDDIDLTEALIVFQIAGQILGFDGSALFSEDLYRTAPFDPSISIPGFLDQVTAPLDDKAARQLDKATRLPKKLPSYLDGNVLGLIRQLRADFAKAPVLAELLESRESPRGSNWWVANGQVTETGRPMIANDPHLALDTPSTFYEVHLTVQADGPGRLNQIGVSFPGTAGIILGCNDWLCWGATVHPMDVTDVYVEELLVDPALGAPVASVFDGQPEPLTLIPQTFGVNVLDVGEPDTIADAGVGLTEGGLTLVVPRRNNGPIIAVAPTEDPAVLLGLSVQYTGWRATREIDTIRTWARARTIAEFKDGLKSFDVGSQNFSVADRRGGIAYFTSAEMPIREDLQQLNAPDGGVPPFLLRDGTHGLRHEWMSIRRPKPGQSLNFEILGLNEMPQVVNPAQGFILNCNNDPIGTSLDNNPLNQLRAPGKGGLYYLNPGYATGFRQGRLVRLFDQALANGGTVSMDDFKAFQANHQLLDAEVFVPYILDAFAAATAAGAPAELAALGADAGVAEAVNRLAAWDFSTPTGLAEGYDPGDDPANLPAPSQAEIDASVAASIYAAWRSHAVRSTIDATLERVDTALGQIDPSLAELDLAGHAPGSSSALSALRHHLDTFDTNQGVGASGLPFFLIPGVEPEVARDRILLASLRAGLDMLASDAFAPAFANSTDQDDYRWGRLHRIVFNHALGGPFNVPNAGGLADLAPDLPGVARSGGLGALDASAHSARASSVNGFMFGSGPSRRFVGEMMPRGPEAEQVLPGGQSGVLGSPFQADQLHLWLTNDYRDLRRRPRQAIDATVTVQQFIPGGGT